MIKILPLLFVLLSIPFVAMANDAVPTDVPTDVTVGADFVSAMDLAASEPDKTECATAAFANGLQQAASAISEADSEAIVQQWVIQVFADKSVLNNVLACPEIANAADDDTIKFMPIQYRFPGGREITINYETQPKILKQRLMLADKRGLPSDPSPRITADGDTVWTNTDPAWYAIMVTEHGALDQFVGPDKNNTISLEYIREHVDDLFPSGNGGKCTDRSAIARDNTVVNRVMREKTVDVEDDTNDYYIAGDKDLRWIGYAEIAFDVILTVVTFGGGQILTGTAKAARAARTLNNMRPVLRSLRQVDKVQDYVRMAGKLDKANDALKKLDKAKDAAEYAKKMDEVKDLTKKMKDLENADDRVKQFKQISETYQEINKYRNALRGVRGLRARAQTGNILARGFKALKAVNSGTKKLNKAARVARSGMKSGRIKDFLFQSTMRNIGGLGKAASNTGIIYAVLKFGADMYDMTETSTGEFTNNVEFAPLLLLSADDLQGQENIVNHGMWLMWAGSSTSATDDDAAYLQAMDFAAKFHQDLLEEQDGEARPCNVDIFVVRPILANPDSNNAALYYLIMNDVPWTTAD